jgi:hypothetical protein
MRKKVRGRVIGKEGGWERGFGNRKLKRNMVDIGRARRVERERDDWGRVKTSNRNRRRLG